MGRTVSMGDLVTRALTLADQENSSSISSTVCKIFIDRGYRQLYGELAKPGVGYFDTEAAITTTGGATYALPSDHLMTLGIDYLVDSQGRRSPLRKLMNAERAQYAGMTGTAYAYDVVGSNLTLYPTPPTGQTYYHRYIPQPSDITAAADATLIEMATLDGEEFLLWSVVYMIRDKLEQDTRTAQEEREQARVRVQEDAIMRTLESRSMVIEDDIGNALYDPRLDPADWRWGR